MFQRILVPTDLSDRTIKALQVASDVAAADDAQLMLLHVIETIAGADFDELSSFYGTLEKRARNRLNDIMTRASIRHAQIEAYIVVGKRVEETLRFAHANGVDLIVLASHPIDPSQPGSSISTMSYKLGILAPCAVLLVK